jgi:hypothetical protein
MYAPRQNACRTTKPLDWRSNCSKSCQYALEGLHTEMNKVKKDEKKKPEVNNNDSTMENGQVGCLLDSCLDRMYT